MRHDQTTLWRIAGTSTSKKMPKPSRRNPRARASPPMSIICDIGSCRLISRAPCCTARSRTSAMMASW